MSVFRVIDEKAFGGKRVFRNLRGNGGLKVKVLASGTSMGTEKGVVAYSVATAGCYIAVNTAGTGTKFNV